MFSRALDMLKTRGWRVLLRAAYSRCQGLFAGQVKSFKHHKTAFADKSGIEIGGPSAVFSSHGIFPVYAIVGSLDNCDYSSNTTWRTQNSEIYQDYHFQKNRKPGKQFVVEATALSRLSSETYDFLLSSHMLEHTSNPISALVEWCQLLKTGGVLVLVLPNKVNTFDHRRPVTTMAHLIKDYENKTGEDDLTHLPEILNLHDFDRDPYIANVAGFESRCKNNLVNRCMHHHVFDMKLATDLLKFGDFEVMTTEILLPHHLFLLARKKAVSVLSMPFLR